MKKASAVFSEQTEKMTLVFPKNIPVDRLTPVRIREILPCVSFSGLWNYHFFRKTPTEFTQFMIELSRRDVEEFRVLMKPSILTFLFGDDLNENDEKNLNGSQKLKWCSLDLANEDVETLR